MTVISVTSPQSQTLIDEGNETDTLDATGKTVTTTTEKTITTNVINTNTTATGQKPNLVIIMTDEHNLRTLSCYKSIYPPVWGEGVEVHTPNIDSLAKDGVIFTNFNAISPLCTPSRGSFMSGLYPNFTGAPSNHHAMNKNIITFAEILQNTGYYTGFIGKWHLNGDEKPGFANENRPFGFYENRYQFNRGHWKIFNDDTGTNETNVYQWKDRAKVKIKIEDAYATDFLFNKGIDFIERQIEEEKQFALMLSIPDPHGPNYVRHPYDTMYNNMTFKLPPSAVAAYHKNPALPGWSPVITNLTTADENIKSIEGDEKWQESMRNYFGMVKLIDDKVGDLLLSLKDKGQDENTIVVFTSDHGDMMGEHATYNKGKPYLSSAGVPFILRYPSRVKKSKVIKTAYSSPDFTPTILSLMGVNHSDMTFQGIDGSDEILNDSTLSERAQVRFLLKDNNMQWVAAVDRQYKFVLADFDRPWLFDSKEDPNELINYSIDPSYNGILKNLQNKLLNAMERYNLPLVNSTTIFVDHPTCIDTKNQISVLPYRECSDMKYDECKNSCYSEELSKLCPVTCGSCCEDSPGVLRHNGELKGCDDLVLDQQLVCNWKIKLFCPITCGEIIPELCKQPAYSSLPSMIPTNAQSNTTSLELINRSSVKPSTASSPSPSTSLEPINRSSVKPSTVLSPSPSALL